MKIKEMYQEQLDMKYWVEEKGGWCFLHGLGFQTMIRNKEIAYELCSILQIEYGLEELNFNIRANLHMRINKVAKAYDMTQLKSKYDSIKLIKILDELEK